MAPTLTMWKTGAWKHPDEKAKEEPCDIEIQEKTPVKKSSSSWARLIRKIWLEDTECCPNCGQKMRIISFISSSQPDVVDKILDHPDMRTSQRSPPPLEKSQWFTSAPETQHSGEDDSGFYPDSIWPDESYL